MPPQRENTTNSRRRCAHGRHSVDLLAALWAVSHVHSDMKMFRVQQLLLCRLMTLKETEVAPDQLTVAAKPFWPLGHNSGLMLMTPFCPPHDEQTGAAHLPPDGAWSLVRTTSAHNPPLFSLLSQFFFLFLACFIILRRCWAEPAPRPRHWMSNAFLCSLQSFPRHPFPTKAIHFCCISRAFKPATYQA